MAACIEAVESEDAGRRAQLMDDIRQYNQEDLDATWAVLEWLRRQGGQHAASDGHQAGDRRHPRHTGS
jgi:predicted RecB family nuclease